MMKFIDDFLNRTTMYRLTMYYLIGLLSIATIFGILGVLSYDPITILFSSGFIVLVCSITNWIFAKVYNAQTNSESFYITAFVLVLIITPPTGLLDYQYIALAGFASVFAMASKYIFAIKKKHIFNPASFGVVAVSLILGESASWWIGTIWMMPFVLIGGIFLTKKLIRKELVYGFIFVSLICVTIGRYTSIGDVSSTIWQALASSPILFFAFVMLTEPLTTPPTKILRLGYGIITGILFYPALNIFNIYFTPELALLTGNVYSYLVSSKNKLLLVLEDKIKIARDTYEFIFSSNQKLYFKPGQYLEWTLGHKNADSRGNRRYFTIASSPTEDDIRIGVKFYPNSSTYKNGLCMLQMTDTIMAGQLAGDFTMPKDKNKKLAFIAGGIGITPFRSMIKYLIDKKERRDIRLFYSNKSYLDVAYKDILNQAEREFGISTVYNLGFLTPEIIKKELPDYRQRYFYISGPSGMVNSFEKSLLGMGVTSSQIKKDFFPGFA